MGRGILNVIGDDSQLIPYRPKLNKLTGSINATILLQQIIYRWKSKGHARFYKFLKPCQNRLYREGDSFCEELGMSEREFRYARDKIATKIMAGDSLNAVLESKEVNAMVIYFTDKYHVTWYTINEALCNELIDRLYDDSEAELQNVIQHKNDKTQFIYPTETTTKKVEDELFEDELENTENVLDKAAKRPRKVATLVPEDFPIPETGGVPEFLEMFKAEIDPDVLEYERKAFVAYWTGRGEKKKDWAKTFRNRLDALLKAGKLKKGAIRNVEGSNRKVSQASVERTAELKRRESIDIFADVEN